MKFVSDVKLERLMKSFNDKVNNRLSSKVNKVTADNSSIHTGEKINEPVAIMADQAGSFKGMIKITMPKAWTSTMMSFDVNCYDYSGKGKFIYHVSGYNYEQDKRWTNCQISIEGNPVTRKVRFAFDGSKCCLIIGDAETQWSYPKCVVENLLVTHYGTIGWDTGWSVTRIKDEVGLTGFLSPMDTTINHDHDGRYFRIGLIKDNITDFNIALSNGKFYVGSETDIPNAPYKGGIYGFLEVVGWRDEYIQTFYTKPGMDVFMRQYSQGAWKSWRQISTYGHDHHDAYYVKSQIDTKLNAKANTVHAHDDLYMRYRAGVVTDFNTTLSAGVYHVYTPDMNGAPYAGAIFGVLEVTPIGTTKSVFQKMVTTGGKIFTRYYNDKETTFSNWIELANKNHFHDDRYHTKTAVNSLLNQFTEGYRKVAVVDIRDTRSDVSTPKSYSTGLQYEFKTRENINYPVGDGPYSSVITLKPWEDNSGGVATQISFGNNSKDANGQPVLAVRNNGCGDEGWGPWYNLVVSGISRTVDVLPIGDYGLGLNGKSGGLIGGFAGWSADTLFINTYSNDGVQTPTFPKVQISGQMIAPNIREVNGITMNANFGECGLFSGNGDTASFEAQNMYLKSWWGLGFRNNNNDTTMYMDLRLGNFETRGSVSVGNLIKTRGKSLVVSWEDPGDIGEGGVWIRS